MRGRLFAGVILLFLGLGGVWWLRTHKRQSSVPEWQVPPEPQVVDSASVQERTNSTPASKSNFDDAVNQFVERTQADPTYEWKQPINFYGKVVDQDGMPIEGASVDFSWTDLSPEGTSQHHTVSDSSGLFAMLNQRGKRLSVTARKEGYYSARGCAAGKL